MYRQCTLLRVCLSTTTRVACITITRCGLKGWRRTPPLNSTGTTAPERTPVLNEGQGLAVGKPGRHTLEAAGDGPRGGGCRDQRPARRLRLARRNLWHLGADLFRPGGMAGPGVLTGGDGSGCWSRASASRCAQHQASVAMSGINTTIPVLQ